MVQNMGNSEDMRFNFTPHEREAVEALKGACDKQEIAYESLFELAKYALVSNSSADDSDPDAAQIRLETALKRIKKRNKWAAKHSLDQIDGRKAILEIDQEFPGFFVTKYTRDHDQRVVVAQHQGMAPTKFVLASKENMAKYFKAEQLRVSLGACDMEEARRGVALMGTADGKLSTSKALSYVRLLSKTRESFEPMHPNRITRVYTQVPGFLSYVATPAKKLLPARLVNRIRIFGTVEEMNKEVVQVEEDISIEEWLSQRQAVYEETCDKLKL